MLHSIPTKLFMSCNGKLTYINALNSKIYSMCLYVKENIQNLLYKVSNNCYYTQRKSSLGSTIFLLVYLPQVSIKFHACHAMCYQTQIVQNHQSLKYYNQKDCSNQNEHKQVKNMNPKVYPKHTWQAMSQDLLGDLLCKKSLRTSMTDPKSALTDTGGFAYCPIPAIAPE